MQASATRTTKQHSLREVVLLMVANDPGRPSGHEYAVEPATKHSTGTVCKGGPRIEVVADAQRFFRWAPMQKAGGAVINKTHPLILQAHGHSTKAVCH